MQVKLVLLLFRVWDVLCVWVSFVCLGVFGWLVWGFVLGFFSDLGCGVDFCIAGW